MKSQAYQLVKPEYELPENQTTAILAVSTSLNFHASLPFYKPTPQLELKELASSMGVGNIYVKDESHRFGLKAFKGLGASYAIKKIMEKDPGITTFCTATDGNHGRAVAWAAKLFGKEAVVFVPGDITEYRLNTIEKEGARVEKIDGNYEDATTAAEKASKDNGWQLVQDAAWENYEEIPAYIMAGYITHFKELEYSIHRIAKPEVDLVFLQSGVGSWPASAVWYYANRYGRSRPKLVIVEPEEAAGFLASLKEGRRTSPNGNYNTIMAGLNCGIPSLSAWEILHKNVDASMAIPDEFAREAIRRLYFSKGEDPKIISGESGVGGVAGLIALLEDPKFEELKNSLGINRDTRILCYSTEGATDPESFKKIINQSVS